MIYLTGDTHGGMDIQCLSSKNFPEGKTLTKDDYVVILGDFGLLWSEGDKTDAHWLDWLDSKPWTTLWIDGNHENFDMIEQLPVVPMFGDMVGKVNDSVFHLRRGIVYDIDGHSIFCMGGALSIDKHLRTEGKSWWPQEIPNEREWERAWSNLLDKGMEVDYVFAHTCPTDILACYGIKPTPGCKDKLIDPTSAKLQDIAHSLQFKVWYHAHLHYDTTKWGRFVSLYNSVIKLGNTP